MAAGNLKGGWETGAGPESKISSFPKINNSALTPPSTSTEHSLADFIL